jgi:hypothetical protein
MLVLASGIGSMRRKNDYFAINKCLVFPDAASLFNPSGIQERRGGKKTSRENTPENTHKISD